MLFAEDREVTEMSEEFVNWATPAKEDEFDLFAD
jgi:hypothetical protein